MDKPWRDKETLMRLYHGEDMTSYEVADELGCSSSAVLTNLEKNGIEKKEPGVQYEFDADVIEEMYHEKRMPISDIADEFDVSYTAIYNFMDRNDIETNRTMYRGGRNNYASYFQDNNGYMRWSTSYNGERAHCLVHRLLAVAEYGFDEVADKVVHHENGVKWDNRPENIKPMTKKAHDSHETSLLWENGVLGE